MTKNEREEILKYDFYDLVGIGSVGMSDHEKIECWINVMGAKKGNTYQITFQGRFKGAIQPFHRLSARRSGESEIEAIRALKEMYETKLILTITTRHDRRRN